MTTTTNTPRIGSYVFNCHNTHDLRRVIEDQAIVLEDGEFVVESEATGYRTICAPTGRTRQFWHEDCPTFTRYEIETYADEVGTIWGRRSTRLLGTFATRRHNMRAV